MLAIRMKELTLLTHGLKLPKWSLQTVKKSVFTAIKRIGPMYFISNTGFIFSKTVETIATGQQNKDKESQFRI
jgi:hypothetical protein